MSGATHSNRLEDQAASTALNSQREQRRPSVLDDDGKLSSASAAMSLKYAQAQDLPSFPSAGLKMSSAGAAASIADSNKKSFEHWKPGSIPAANKAALLAKDYEMDPLWQPELSTASSKAALLAHRDTPSVEIWKAQGTEHGHSAAGQALKTKPPNAIHERDIPADVRQKALLAATGAMSGSRPRAGSLPANKGGNTNWALQAATKSQKGGPTGGAFASGDPGFEAARVQNMAKNNVNRQLYGSTPPVAIEVEEKNRQDMLRASAVAMAKKMYAIQQTHIDEASGVSRNDGRAAARSSHQRNRSNSSSVAGDDASTARAPQYENLEEAARRLAQERLAKLHDEHAEYRQYYGAGSASTNTRSRLSTRLRRRNSTGSRDNSSDDEEQSHRIRKQMSLFQSKLAEVDGKKRQADRDALLQAAHRNVEARMAKMDEQVFQDTGKASPAQRDLWERQAREKAQAASDERMVNVGKVHIGGGKYLDQADVDAIAKARLQPTLDEINDTAEKQRARDEEIRLEHERAQEQLAKERAREAEVKREVKAAQDHEKLEARRKKEEEKQASREQAAADKEQRKAEKERLRREKDEKEAAAIAEKARLRLEKEQKQAEVSAEREKRQAEAAAEIERSQTEKDEQRKSAEIKPGRFGGILKRKGKENEAGETEAVQATSTESSSEAEPVRLSADGNTVHDQVTVPGAMEPDIGATRSVTYESTAPAAVKAEETPISPARRESRVKSWFKSHLKSSNKLTKEEATRESTTVAGEDVGKARDESIRDVAMAGKETDDLYGTNSKDERPVSPIRDVEVGRSSRSSSISSASSHEVTTAEARPLSGQEHMAQVGRTGMKAKLMKKIKPNKDEVGNPAQASFVTSNTTDDEDFEEAKDKFEEDKLTLPPSIATSNRPVSPRSSHEHSKFKEDL